MKGKIKILSLILAVAMASSLFVACKSDTPATTSSDSGASTPTESKTEDKPTEVTEISWYFGGDAPKQPDAVYEALNAKSVADIGVKVNFKFTTGDDKTLRSALSTGDKDLDIAFACAWFANYIGMAQDNAFVDLTDLLPEKAPKLWSELPEKLWQGSKVNGKIYGVPVWKDAAAQQFWFVRKDILEAAGATEDLKKAGLELDSMTPTLEKIKAWHDADPAKNVYSEGNTAPINYNKAGINGHDNMWDTLHMDTRVGVKVKAGDNSNTKVQSFYTDPEYIADLKTLKKWADAGLSNGLNASTVEQEYPLVTVGTAQGWDGAQYGSWGGPLKGYDVVIQPKTTPLLTTSTAQGAVNCIGAGSTKVDAALKYLEYVNTNPEYRDMLTYGIKDTNWRLSTKEDVQAYFEGGLKEGETVDQAAVDAYADIAVGKTVQILTGDSWTLWNFAAGSWKYLTPAIGASPDMNTNITGSLDSAQGTKLLGFAPNFDSIKDPITVCTSLIKEKMEALQCGAVKDVDATVSKLMKDLDAAGYQDIIKEMQTQVDAFLASGK